MPLEITPAVTQLRNRVGTEGFGEPRPIEEQNQAGHQTFADMVQDAIHSVDQAQKTADREVENVIMGTSDNIHGAMIAMEKAQLSFQLLMEVRNKAVETYKELSRMQI